MAPIQFKEKSCGFTINNSRSVCRKDTHTEAFSENENEDEYGFYVATRKKKTNGERQLTKKFLKSQKNRGRTEEVKLTIDGGREASPATSHLGFFGVFVRRLRFP